MLATTPRSPRLRLHRETVRSLTVQPSLRGEGGGRHFDRNLSPVS